jgi:hypothetical protein
MGTHIPKQQNITTEFKSLPYDNGNDVLKEKMDNLRNNVIFLSLASQCIDVAKKKTE